MRQAERRIGLDVAGARGMPRLARWALASCVVAGCGTSHTRGAEDAAVSGAAGISGTSASGGKEPRAGSSNGGSSAQGGTLMAAGQAAIGGSGGAANPSNGGGGRTRAMVAAATRSAEVQRGIAVARAGTAGRGGAGAGGTAGRGGAGAGGTAGRGGAGGTAGRGGAGAGGTAGRGGAGAGGTAGRGGAGAGGVGGGSTMGGAGGMCSTPIGMPPGAACGITGKVTLDYLADTASASQLSFSVRLRTASWYGAVPLNQIEVQYYSRSKRTLGFRRRSTPSHRTDLDPLPTIPRRVKSASSSSSLHKNHHQF